MDGLVPVGGAFGGFALYGLIAYYKTRPQSWQPRGGAKVNFAIDAW